MAILRVRSWDDFQHYKDRAPVWIKLHKKLLDNYDYARLPLASKALAPMLWLLASESTDGTVDFDLGRIAYRLRESEGLVLEAIQGLVRGGFLSVDNDLDGAASELLSGCLQDACLETEEEKRKSIEEANASSRRKRSAPDLPACPFDEIVALYHEKLPELPGVRLMEGKRKDAVRAFWRWVLTSTKSDGQRRANDADQALTWIGAYFERGRSNDFIMGRTGRGEGHANWRPDIEFVIGEKGRKHIIERTVDA